MFLCFGLLATSINFEQLIFDLKNEHTFAPPRCYILDMIVIFNTYICVTILFNTIGCANYNYILKEEVH